MKRITAMLMAMAFAAFALTGCSSDESSSSASEQNISGAASGNGTTLSAPPVISMPNETTSAEEEIIRKKANSMEELLIGLANAIGSNNEDEFNSYISPKYRNHNTYGYKTIHKQFIEALNNAGLDFKKTYTYKDFCFFKEEDGKSYEFMLIEAPDDVRFDLGQFSYGYDLENDEYFIINVPFVPIKGRYERALKNAEPLDLSEYVPGEVTE